MKRKVFAVNRLFPLRSVTSASPVVGCPVLDVCSIHVPVLGPADVHLIWQTVRASVIGPADTQEAQYICASSLVEPHNVSECEKGVKTS